MHAIKRILVPVDYSTPSGDALDFALSLAGSFGASVEVLHVWTEAAQLDANLANEVHRAVAKKAEEDMTDFLSKFGAPPGVTLSRRVINGTPAQVIIDLSKRFDLIAMGTRGRAALDRLLMGSVAARVVQQAACPVMTLREPGRNVRRILVPVDFSEGSREAMIVGSTFARASSAEIVVLHVWSAPMIAGAGDVLVARPDQPPMNAASWIEHAARDALDRFAAEFSGEEIRVDSQLASGRPAETIVATAQDFDLIVMGTHGRSGASHVFLGSVAERVIRLASRPVITLREASTRSR